MLQYLTDLIGRTGHWAYFILFLGAMLESAAFLGLIVPGESLVLVAGFFAAQGLLDLDVLIVVVALGAALGDSIGYELGRWMGRPALLRYGSHFGLTQASIDKSDVFFDRHGSKAVFLGRFVGFARALVPFLAGSSQMAYRRFLPYNISGALLWASAVVLLGYFLGASWERAGLWLGQASALLGGLLLFVFLLIWLWRWAVKNELLIRHGWSHFLERKTVHALRMRLAPQLAFVKARLSRSGYLGLQLTSGALALIGASWLFGGVAEDVVHGDPLTLVDVQVAQWFHEHATPFVTQIMLAITHLHDPLPVTIAVALIASYLAWKRNWYWLTCLVLTVPFGMLLNVGMKYSFHRARPSFANPLLVESSYSFPSGHVAGATLFYGFLAAMVIAQIESWRWRVMIVLGAIAVVVLVALTRMYLGVHYLSDVLAAFSEGIAWLALCLTGMNTFWQHDSARRSAKRK